MNEHPLNEVRRESMKVLVDKGWANKDYAHLSFRGGRYMAEIIFKALTEE